MKVTLFYNKSVHENAAHYYEKAKESREKAEGVRKAIEETEKAIAEAKKPRKKEVRVKRQKEWFESFHFCHTGGAKLMLGGRSAQQNDQLVSKRMTENDLFFHADIQGGAVVVLVGGTGASEDDLRETAQFAACFSNAWKNANASVDVYAVHKKQLTKNVSGGFVPAGAFAILGERKWFRATALALRIGLGEGGRVELLPDISKTRLKDELVLIPSLAGKDKGALAKSLAKRFGVHPDELLELLPNGKTKTIESRNR
ncbi:MAG: NFACT RNA binding domain-containing protein [Candidatus Micrarchaeota archaeon]